MRRLSCKAGRILTAGLCALAACFAGPLAAAELDCEGTSAGALVAAYGSNSAPRVLALQGSVPIVTMEPFAAFLEAMGYPPERLAHPADGARSLSSYVDARRFAGEIAWHYERDGVMPVLVGHSMGGMIVMKALHELAGRNGAVPVFDPLARGEQSRTWIVDPASGAQRSVTSLRVGFAAALATGSLPRILLAQWDALALLRDVPDSVVDFSGFSIPWDPIAGTGPYPTPFHATGRAQVRNIVLPVRYSHVRLPAVEHLARQPATRGWIETWRPGADATAPTAVNVDNLLHAADLWFGIKRQWCLGAQAVRGGRAS
jgi:pimeloyl-ACP methyl ester carboxylesterase